MYKLEYLPIAMYDMVEIAKYISQDLCDPQAAENLAYGMIQAAERLAAFPYVCPIHRALKPLKYEYRKLLVRNYIMFYWVDEKERKVTIARVIYSRRDYENFLL